MNLRAMRNGVFETIDFIDMGQVALSGAYRSIWVIGGRQVVSETDGMLIIAQGDDVRFENDLKALEHEGFSGPLESWDASGWSTLGVIGGKMTGMSPPRFAFTGPTLTRPPISLRPGSLHFAGSDHKSLPRWLKPDPKVADTMGWRAWLWHGGHERLVSPHHHALWDKPYLGAAYWADGDGALRGSAGIHARLVPRHWKIVGWPDDSSSSDLDPNPALVTGIVERFGRYVLGTEGWRAEQVIIRELMAPSTEIGLALERVYPDVIVHYPDQIEEGDLSCKSVKSSELEKGNRSALPLLPRSPAPPPSPSPDDLFQQSFLLGLMQPQILPPPSVIALPSPPDPLKAMRTPMITYTYDGDPRAGSSAMAKQMTWLAVLWLLCAAGWFFGLALLRLHA